MTGPSAETPAAAAPDLDRVRRLLADHGVRHVGIAAADVLEETRTTLHDRKDRGLHDGMQFTYRNPDRSTDPRRAVPDARSVIVAARSYVTATDPVPPGVGVAARVGRYAWIDHYEPLRVALRDVAAEIEAAGFTARVYADDNSLVDRAIAHEAGIGWFGKNANLLLPGAGSFFVLGSIVTTAPYPTADAPALDGCGTCVACIDGCPTDAIIEPGVIDGARCLSWVLQKPGPIPVRFREAVHDRLYGCDDCQDVCPITIRLGSRHAIDLDDLGDDVQAFVDALDLLDLDDTAIEARYGRWWIAGREMRWLRRNALVVVGNVADPTDERVRRVVRRYVSDGDVILQEHAHWADRRLDQRLAPPSDGANHDT